MQNIRYEMIPKTIHYSSKIKYTEVEKAPLIDSFSRHDFNIIQLWKISRGKLHSNIHEA